MYRVEVKPGNVIEVFEDDKTVPFLRQPWWPDQTPWSNEAEARSWADMLIESIEVESAPYAPTGPGKERVAKPTPEQIAEMQSRQNR